MKDGQKGIYIVLSANGERSTATCCNMAILEVAPDKGRMEKCGHGWRSVGSGFHCSELLSSLHDCVQCSALHCTALHCSAVQCRALNVMQCIEVQCSAVH